MYIENYRLYEHNISFELPQNVRITATPDGNLFFFRDDEPWLISAFLEMGYFGPKELREHVSDRMENNDIGTMRTAQRTVNGILFHQACSSTVSCPEDQHYTSFFNIQLDETAWMHLMIGVDFCDFGSSPDKNLEDHPLVAGLINSVRQEPFEAYRELPSRMIEIHAARNIKK